MSLTLGLIVWFYERRKKQENPAGKKARGAKRTRPWEKKKDGKIGKQAEEKIGSIAYFYAQ